MGIQRFITVCKLMVAATRAISMKKLTKTKDIPTLKEKSHNPSSTALLSREEVYDLLKKHKLL